MLSVVIPSLNEAARLAGCIAALQPLPWPAAEIIVADGGSSDATVQIAEGFGVRVVHTARGRGRQLAAGAAVATQPWLLFLHADTRLAPEWRSVATAFVRDTADGSRAAVFAFALDDPSPQARRIERLVAWRNRVLHLPYGDQGLLIARSLYDDIGGFRMLELMEDVDIVHRIGSRRLQLLDLAAITAADRYRRDGWWRRPMRNLVCLHLYFAGVPPRFIAKLYG